MLDKIVSSLADALHDVPDGATIIVGGFGGSGSPIALINALIEHGTPAGVAVKDVTAQLQSPSDVLCLTRARATDGGQTHLTFRNSTVLRERELPLFSRSAHALKERVWRSLGLPSQLVDPAAAEHGSCGDENLTPVRTFECISTLK